MNLKRVMITAGATLMLVISASVLIQAGQRDRMMMGNYDPKTEVTIQGTVEKVDRVSSGKMPGPGIHLIVRSGSETTDVHLGPAAFIDKTMTFKEGDAVQIIGSKVTMMGKPAVIAREVKKGDQTLKLRNEKGVPLWSRGRRSSKSY